MDNVWRVVQLRGRISSIRRLVNRYVMGRPSGNVVLLVVDCLRYRNTSFAGYVRRTTPFLDSLRVKLRAYSASPHTYSSVPSILTGLYPHNHGAVIEGHVKDMEALRSYRPLRRDVATLPEILKALGYDTIFITTIYPAVLPLRGTAVTYREMGKASASRALDEALKMIRKSLRRGRRFFAYVHLGDLHEPLNPPKEYANFFGEVEPLPNIDRWAYRRPEEWVGEGFEEYRYNRVLLYDNTLRYVDDAIRGFVAELEDLVDEPLLIVVTADHGEEFWEHADVEARYFYDPRGFYGVGHGHNLFNEVIEVPLILHELGSNRLREVEAVGGRIASTVDIVPTVLNWMGLEFVDGLFDGYSLLRGLPADRWVLSEAVAYGYEKKALIVGRYKLLYSEGDRVAWVFDLERDPYERSPMDSGELVSHMVNRLKRVLAGSLLRRLRRLGLT